MSLDEETRGILEGLMRQLGDVANEGRETNRLVRTQGRELRTLQRYVYGSNPPPPGDESLTEQARAAFESASDAEDAAEEAHGDLVDFKASVMRELGEIRRELKPQSQALGVGVHGLKWLSTREGRTLTAAIAAALFAVAAALGAARVVAVAPAAVAVVPLLDGGAPR